MLSTPDSNHRMNPDQIADPEHTFSVLPLSPTEKRVCTLLLHGYTEKKVAEQMQRSPNTIHVHVRNIYRKLGIRARKELFSYPNLVNIIVKEDQD